MKNGIMKCTGLLFGLMFVLLLLPQTAASVEWEDNFDDGTFTPEWTVEDGSWDVVDGSLVAVYDGPVNHNIRRNSSQVVGTWSFDIFYVYTENNAGGVEITFLANGSDDYSMSLSQPGEFGICPRLKLTGGVALNMTDLEVGSHTWTEFDITRNSAGEMHVFVNKTGPVAEPTVSIVDTTYSSSEKFRIYCYFNVEGTRIDNIVVDDEILITPPPPPDTTTPTDTSPTNGETTPPPSDSTLLIVGAGVAGVVIIVAVVFLRRR